MNKEENKSVLGFFLSLIGMIKTDYYNVLFALIGFWGLLITCFSAYRILLDILKKQIELKKLENEQYHNNKE